MGQGKNLLIILLLFISFIFKTKAYSKDYSPELQDVTEKWIFGYYPVSAFQFKYQYINKEENGDIIRIFHFYAKNNDLDTKKPSPFYLRRIEVFYTGGDWMKHGFIYFITNVEQIRSVDGHPVGYYPDGKPFMNYSDNPRPYFIPELSTTDYETGDSKPSINPFDVELLKEFILLNFLDKDGFINEKFIPICANRNQIEEASRYPCDVHGHRERNY